jgi:hypothetical protein
MPNTNTKKRAAIKIARKRILNRGGTLRPTREFSLIENSGGFTTFFNGA